MIDIHSHLLYGLDDGAGSIAESKQMLDAASIQNITDIVLTPHLRRGMFRYDIEKVDRHFDELKKYADSIGIRIYPGTEYHVDKEILDSIKKGEVHTLADGRYVLTEYSHDSEPGFVKWMTRELLYNGYIPVIAHVERCISLTDDFENIYELKNAGALIQSNADAVLGLDGRPLKKLCRRLLKENLVDLVAGDSHNIRERSCHMEECYKYLSREYGAETAENLLQNNPALIINGENG